MAWGERKDEGMLDKSLRAYEESTGGVPDTRDFVALEDSVKEWEKSNGAE